MNGRSRGRAVKRRRRQQPVEEEDVHASMQVTVHAEPLTLLAVVKSFLDMLVRLLWNPQSGALYSFVRIPPRVLRPFAGAPVYGMSLTFAERLCAVGCGFKGKLVRLLSLGLGRHSELQTTSGNCRKMMQFNVRRVAAGLAAAVRNKFVREAEELCASGQFAAALGPLQRAIESGHLPSRALKAWLLAHGRQGVPQNLDAALELATEGMRLGCHHCQGVMAFLDPNDAVSLELARKSASNNSMYGQWMLGQLQHSLDPLPAVEYYRLAAAQGLDAAECSLGDMYRCGDGVGPNYAEALRLYHVAAFQGYPDALFKVGLCHQNGEGVPICWREARRWYTLAKAAGHHLAEGSLKTVSELTPSPSPTRFKGTKMQKQQHEQQQQQHHVGPISPPHQWSRKASNSGQMVCNICLEELGLGKWRLQQGSRVRIEGLQEKPEMNGRIGVVCSVFDQQKERWIVAIDANDAGPAVKKSIRPANLILLPTSDFSHTALPHSTSANTRVPPAASTLVMELRCPQLHAFHESCALPWLRVAGTCPTCKFRFPED